MAEDDHPPSKKRSRFFSNGKSMIGTVLKGIKETSSNREQQEITTQPDVSGMSCSSADRDQQAFLAAGAGRSTSVSHGIAIKVSTASIIEDRGGDDNQADLKSLAVRARKRGVLDTAQISGCDPPSTLFPSSFSSTSSTASLPDITSSSGTTSSQSSFSPSITVQASPPRKGLSSESKKISQVSQFQSLDVLEQPRLRPLSIHPANHPHNISTTTLGPSQGMLDGNAIQNSFDPFLSVSKFRHGLSNNTPIISSNRAQRCSVLPQMGIARWELHEDRHSAQATNDKRMNETPNTNIEQSPSCQSTFLLSTGATMLGRSVARRNHSFHINNNHQRMHDGMCFSQSQSAHHTQSVTTRKQNDTMSNLPRPQTLLAGHDNRTTENATLDLDRDANGALLPSHCRSIGMQRPLEPSNVRPFVQRETIPPANYYTSPKRSAINIAADASNPKRKRPGPLPPPPAYIYVHSNDPYFNIFTNGFLLYPELCFVLASHLPLRDLISLYSISKDFHTIIDRRFTTVCLAQAIKKAPHSAQSFPFRMYSQFCRVDPAARLPHPNPAKAAQHVPRMIPSFRWVAFVLHREKVVHELMTVFAERGCPLPARCALALKRIWMLLDIPDNARRIAIIHNHRLFTDLDLYFLMCFFVKLDMIANDPVAATKRDGLRKLLLSHEGGLDTILKVLKREMWCKNSDFLAAWVRITMGLENIPAQRLDELNVKSVFGVPRDEIGTGKYEHWGKQGIVDERSGQRRPYLLRPDQLVMREAIRRGMRFKKHFMRCILYGYVRSDTLESYAPRTYGRRIAEWNDEDYDNMESTGGFRALGGDDDDNGGDPLLDLGDTNRGSEFTIRKEDTGKMEHDAMVSQRPALKQLYEISEAERQGRTGFGINVFGDD